MSRLSASRVPLAKNRAGHSLLPTPLPRRSLSRRAIVRTEQRLKGDGGFPASRSRGDGTAPGVTHRIFWRQQI
jgi:hypothetical protein